MSVFYKVVQKKNPTQPDTAGKFYAQAMVTGEVSMDKLCERISRASTASRGDVAVVISSLADEVIDMLENGNSVRLGDLGTMRISLSSSGEADSDNVTVNNIRRGKIIFNPSTRLKERVRRLSFKQWAATGTATPPPVTPPSGGDPGGDGSDPYE